MSQIALSERVSQVNPWARRLPWGNLKFPSFSPSFFLSLYVLNSFLLSIFYSLLPIHSSIFLSFPSCLPSLNPSLPSFFILHLFFFLTLRQSLHPSLDLSISPSIHSLSPLLLSTTLAPTARGAVNERLFGELSLRANAKDHKQELKCFVLPRNVQWHIQSLPPQLELLKWWWGGLMTPSSQ